MIYTRLTKKAMTVAYDAHKNQLDKANLPYINHPLHVAESMDDEYSTCAALLHDVVEDAKKEYSFETLTEMGFPKAVVDAVEALTHRKGEDYYSYLERIKENPIAVKVKKSDLRHNMDLSRLNEITHEDVERNRKYRISLMILNGQNPIECQTMTDEEIEAKLKEDVQK